MLDDCRAAFHPVATIDVAQAAVVADHGMMDVAAYHAVDPAPSGLEGEGALVGADEIDRILDLELGPLRERPIGKPERSSYGVAMGIEPDCDFVGVVAQTREPSRVSNHHIEEIPVSHQIALAVDVDVEGVLELFDALQVPVVLVV